MRSEGLLAVNDADLALRAAFEGIGIVQLPELVVADNVIGAAHRVNDGKHAAADTAAARPSRGGHSVLQTKACRMSAEASQISSIEPPDPSGRYHGSTSNASMRLTRVLVVDDDPSVQHMLVNYLEQHDMRVSSASQRQEATRQFAVAEPNVMILDLRLGQEDGLDLLREIRSRSDVPVIITTGHCREEIDRVVALELGADDYVTKPFGLRELLARIRAVLRRREVGALPLNESPSKAAASLAVGNSIVVRDA
jgi:CheY-like chemotaxis protein